MTNQHTTETQPTPAEADRARYKDDGRIFFGERADFLTDLARRCAPWREKAALVFVERTLCQTLGHSFYRYYFPSEGVLLGFPAHTPNCDWNFPIQADDHLAFYQSRQCPTNYRFLDRVGYRYRRGKHRGPGYFEIHRLPEVRALWEQIQRADIGSYQLPFTAWRITPAEAETLAALCGRPEFLFHEHAKPSRRKPKAAKAQTLTSSTA